ncbi:uncharacterized protein [Haliotis cracherodii]|uniref:uncharacterized protein n=1 Tax=Haliotis cracherodii TaxID=6455 RepID=UPI0039EAA685
MERANDTEVIELIKHVVHNQKRIATSMNALMEIMSTMARDVTPNEPRRAQISPKEDGPHNSRQLQELRGQLDGLEQRVAVLENSRTYSTGDKAHSRDTDARHHLEGTLPEDLSEVLSTWCSLDSIESIRTSGEEERPADPLEQHKGSHFKAVTLAIVFVIRLAASDTPPVNGEERYTPPIEEKTGGDHLKATALAIVFMIKLMKAQELPLVLDSQREITPGSYDHSRPVRHPSIAVMP